MWRRRSLVMAAAAVLVVGAGGVVAYEWSTGFGSGLEIAGEQISSCYAPSTPEELAHRSTVGTTFAVDPVSLTTDASVSVVAVTMSEPSGGLELLRAVFVPGLEAANGFAGDRPLETTTRVLASMARSVPTSLAVTGRPSTEQADASWHPRVWQLVVTVRAPMGSPDANTPSFDITYRHGHTVGTLRTQDAVRVVNTEHGCSGAAGGPSPSPARSAVAA